MCFRVVESRVCVGRMQRSVVEQTSVTSLIAARDGGACLWAAMFQLPVDKLAQCLPWYPCERVLRLGVEYDGSDDSGRKAFSMICGHAYS